MKKIINKIKNYKPSKYMCYLYFFVPILICTMIAAFKEEDIWFLFNHGKFILNNGFPVIEPFTIHQGFDFVMQQWLSAVLFYTSYSFFGVYGIKLIMLIVNMLMLYFIYKLCMIVSENKFRLSIMITTIIQVLMLVFFTARPWIFTFLNLILVLYIMEIFYKKRNNKVLLFLPLISLIQINMHSSMWLLLFLFILPYFVSLIIEKFKFKKNLGISKLSIIVFIMFLIGFINPYGIDNILYVVNSYGNKYISLLVTEMQNPIIGGFNSVVTVYGDFFFVLLFIIFLIVVLCKKSKMEIRHFFLLVGVTILGLSNIRNIPIFLIGIIPFLASYLSPYCKKLTTNETNYILNKQEKKSYILSCTLLVIIILFSFFTINVSNTNSIEKGVNIILKKDNYKQFKVYTSYSNGSYAGYKGLKVYIDTRAEIFSKKINHKEDIIKEFYLLSKGYLKYNKFINKYKFDYMIIDKNDWLYSRVLKDTNYKRVYKEKKYAVFEHK